MTKIVILLEVFETSILSFFLARYFKIFFFSSFPFGNCITSNHSGKYHMYQDMLTMHNHSFIYDFV